MPPKAVTLASFLPAQLKPQEQAPEPLQLPSGQPRPQRCRCEGPFDLCWRYPANIPNAVCKPTWDRLLAPFQFKGREWTIVELRSLWPHTVQALNERLLKGRMERTLKDDLQDDLQVLVDLIQHSCKPHPRPPRAGMKTLIVQGRILAEAIAQDALFQLDPCDPSAPRPDRDLVDLINRLRERHPNSLLAPALHVLRTLGNTAVHLDRDSARLTDGEIGDAAAVCCRLVVLVVDAYMHMCVNLHAHEETEEALAQPLVEGPVAPIPAPNVLLRQREATTAAPPEEAAAAAASVPAPPAATAAPAAAPVAPPAAALPRVLLGRPATGAVGSGGGGVDGNGDDEEPAGARRGSSGGGGSGARRSCSGSADGAAGRVPYSLVSYDWSAGQQPPPHGPAAAGSGSGSGGVASAGEPPPPQQQHHHHQNPPGSRGWWPPAPMGEAPVAPLLPTPTTLLRRNTELGAGGAAALGPTEAEALAAAATSRPPPPPATSVPNWIQGHPMPYSLTGAFWSAPGGGAAAAATGGGAVAPQFGRLSSGSSGGAGAAAAATLPSAHGAPTAPYVLAAAANPAQIPNAGQTDPGPSGGGLRSAAAASTQSPAGGSPRRCPIYLTHGDAANSNAIVNSNGNGNENPNDQQHHAASWSLPVRSGASSPTHRAQSPQPPHPNPQHPEFQQQQQQQGGAGSWNGAARPVNMGPSEASKRLLQLCAVAPSPPTAKVERLLQAGASPAFPDKSGMTALHLACYWAHGEAARLLLAAQPSAASCVDREGRSPLWVAAQRGHVGLVEALLTESPEGAAQLDVANAAGVTPLRVAAAQGHAAVVEALLQAGAHVDAADKDGFTPLYVSCARCQLEVVRLLLAAGAAPDRADRAGRTPLWAALHPGGAAKAEAPPERRAGVVRALLAAGADVYLLPDGRDRDFCWQLLAASIAAGE